MKCKKKKKKGILASFIQIFTPVSWEYMEELIA